MDCDALIAEGEAVPVEGWDFSWFEGRATEERPSWAYAQLLAQRLRAVGSALDIQTGGGEVLAWALEQARRSPRVLVGAEPWRPNAVLAARRLGPLGGLVVQVDNDAVLPFVDGALELVSSRHPVSVRWDEIARVLAPGGAFLSQMVGAGSNRELYEYLMGPQPPDTRRAADVAAARAEAVGLHIVELRTESLEVAFFDIGAVVHFLRKVVWTVPEFSVERYGDRLRALHAVIERDGRFTCRSQRFLIEARK